MSLLKNGVKKLGLLLGILLLGVTVAYAQDGAPSVDDVLYVINNNDRLSAYFGTPLTISHISNEKNKTVVNPDGSQYGVISFSVRGAKKTADVTASLLREKLGLVVLNLTLIDEQGNKMQYIDGSIKTSEYTEDELTGKSRIFFFKEFLEKAEKNKGHLVLTRSTENNDYLQAAIFKNQEQPCFFIEYSEGFTPENKQLYRAQGGCLSIDEILKVFYLYSFGTDEFKTAIKWDKLKEIVKTPSGGEEFKF